MMIGGYYFAPPEIQRIIYTIGGAVLVIGGGLWLVRRVTRQIVRGVRDGLDDDS